MPPREGTTVDLTPARIAGAHVEGDGDVLDVRRPFDGALIAQVPKLGAADVDRACRAAAAALGRDDFPQHARAEVLERAALLVRERGESFAATISDEAGKPLRAARSEVDRCIGTLTFAAVEARSLTGEMIPMDASATGAGRLGFALRVPLGVVAAIAPFNFPLNLVAHKLTPAIAAGCPVVVKPADATPLSTLHLVDLLIDAGLPPDWVSVVTGTGPDAGQHLVDHPIPAMVTFTGSAPVGWGIAARAPRKRVSLELGSNAPVIVQPDADLADVARRVAASAYGYAGQSCISTQRALVHRSVHEQMLDRLAAEADALTVGDPRDEATDVGPLINPGAADRVQGWIDDAVAGGGRLVTGGKRAGDALLTPAVVDQPPRHSDLYRREAFGPVLVVTPYDGLTEAIELANDTDLALQAGLFTNDVDVALRAVRALHFGGVLVNEVPTYRADQQPYGGLGEAGNTREGPAYAVREMTELRFVSLQAP